MAWNKVPRSIVFEQHFEPCPTTGCFLWLGAIGGHGYGAIRQNGKAVTTHRLAYEKWVGPIPKGMCVCHRCDVPSCINPAHLFLGTHQENMIDGVRKGRIKPPAARFGADHHMGKVTHCAQGHEYTLKNTGRNSVTGFRQCKECIANWQRKKRQEKRDLIKASETTLAG